MARRVIILGSTGSIGTQAVEVIEHCNSLARGARGGHDSGHTDERGDDASFQVVGLSGGNNSALLAAQAKRLGVGHVAVASGDAGADFGSGRVYRGPDAAEHLVREVECDIVIAAIVGVAGLGPTLAAVELGRDVALANKETLVAAGSLVTGVARRTGSRLLPVDSEHSALWQCLLGASNTGADAESPPLAQGSSAIANVRRAILTASGGPFRDWTLEQLGKATPADALKHPTWSMGSKITIDCATLMNKSLELIEAYWLFGLREDQLGMIVHPQSIVHAMVETTEGAVLAQMSAPDMRAPLQFALTHPRRVAPLAPPLDLSRLSRLEFLPVDTRRFPAAGLWTSALGERANTTAGAILNAANEEAVLAFLGHPGEVAFTRIADVVMEAVESVERCPAGTLDDILAAGSAAREFVRRRLSGRSSSAPASSPSAR